MELGEKPLYWVGASKRDLMAMPAAVIRHIGTALSVAQWIFEVVSDFDTNTFRAAYIVRFERAVYVLHCFPKKSARGVRTAKTDVELIERRLKAARTDYEAKYGAVHEKR
jgi:phage-related protein